LARELPLVQQLRQQFATSHCPRAGGNIGVGDDDGRNLDKENEMLDKSTQVGLRMVIAALALTAATVATGAQFSGAIFTTVEDGTTVDANIYDFGTDVYLNGGPQNLHGPALPNGHYYFLVTDPSGHTLLSTDPAVCRQLTVTNGVVSGASPLAGSCAHANGTFNPANGSTPVQLFPFIQTPNDGLEYKAWMVSKDPALGCGPDNVKISNTDSKVLSFPKSCAKTDNFKAELLKDPCANFACG
jgi:hypothetical protein